MMIRLVAFLIVAALLACALIASFAHATPLKQCVAVRVVDGDSLKCAGRPELRLLGIDTPDHLSSYPCRAHIGDHVCDDALASAATASMRQAVLLGPITFLPVTKDRYGRTVAQVFVGAADLQCYQLQAGVARYLRHYDNGGRIRKSCPALAH